MPVICIRAMLQQDGGWTMIEVRGLVKRFRRADGQPFAAVDHLDLTVQPGVVYGLLGPNGAGKTTTLRILATLAEADEGTVVVANIDRRKDPLGVRAKLAYVPAEAGLPDRLSPREVIRLFARIQGVDQPDRVADTWLEKLGAAGYSDRPCSELSTGMKRRVVLARALEDAAVRLLDQRGIGHAGLESGPGGPGIRIGPQHTVIELDLLAEQRLRYESQEFAGHLFKRPIGTGHLEVAERGPHGL